MLMSSLRRGRPLAAIFAVGVFLLLAPLGLGAQTNQPPQITSTPLLAVSVDEAYSYQIAATDPDGDPTSFTMTVAPAGMSLNTDTITWQPTVPGMYNVVVEATDGVNGYDTQTWQVNVTAGAVSSIIILPNDKPTEVSIGNTKQFVVHLFDQYGNTVTSPDITWRADSTVGSVSSDGLFYAEHGGIGFVAARSGAVEQSVGVVVKDIRNDLVTQSDTTTTETTTADDETDSVETDDEAVTEEETNETAGTGEDTDESDEDLSEVANDGETMSTSDEENEEKEPCTNMAHNMIILILIIYGVALVLYYRYERTAPSPAWWIFPILLTIIGLIIYYQNICIDTYLWWPWTLVGIGVITTVYYKGKKKSEIPPEDSQPQLPV